ncbi:MAG: response regulator [Proteobacteria bacterium]|nr:response regulator [Pseudomonadota bacterium]
MAGRTNCAACGEAVEAYSVDLGGGASELRCLQCGLPLERRASGQAAARFRRVLVADDSPFFLASLEEALSSRRLAGEILKAGDGAEAVEMATTALRERRPPALVILDLLMPRLNGLHAAVALRAVERAFGAHRSHILFLSGRRLDAALRPLLDDVAPAHYLNKGSAAAALPQRLEEVLVAISAGSGEGRHG